MSIFWGYYLSPRYFSGSPTLLSFRKEIPIFLLGRIGEYLPSRKAMNGFCFSQTRVGLLRIEKVGYSYFFCIDDKCTSTGFYSLTTFSASIGSLEISEGVRTA